MAFEVSPKTPKITPKESILDPKSYSIVTFVGSKSLRILKF